MISHCPTCGSPVHLDGDGEPYYVQSSQKVCEERDKYKADSEALDWFLKEYPEIMTSFLRLHTNRDCPEHLRKRLERK